MRLAAAFCVAMNALLRTTHGHGYLTAPLVQFRTNTEDPTAYSATIDGASALPPQTGMHYGWGPSLSTEAFTAALGNSTYKTLREFVMQHQVLEPSTAISEDCGRTDGNSSVLQALPDLVVWQHGDGEGFTLSHEGPCEIWCDNERVFVEENCAKSYPQAPARLPYEKVKCVGKKRLQMIWLALHEGTRWQVYMNCAPLADRLRNPSASGGSVSSGEGSMVLLGTVRPAPIPTEAALSTKLPTKTQRPVDASHFHPSPANAGESSNEIAHTGAFDCSSDGQTHETELPRYNMTWRTIRPLPPYTRRPREKTEAGDLANPRIDRRSNIRVLERALAGSRYEDKTTGPAPSDIVVNARKDFETEEKKREQRRGELMKEFGHA